VKILLLGHPVGHSLSPAMQNAALRAVGREDAYEAVDTTPERLAGWISALRDGEHLGANVTVPHKTAVAPLLDAVDATAKELGAVNTVVARGGRLEGHNTDVAGAFEGLLAPVRGSLGRARVLLLGAGGGARAVLAALAREAEMRPARVIVAARREEQAAALAELGERLGLACAAAPWSELRQELAPARVVVNCTPLGLHGEEDPLHGLPLEGRVVLDLAYRAGGTPLFRRAWREGARAIQGDAMLLHQGAEAFRLWTGLEPPVAAMRAALDAELRGGAAGRVE
jgi:shikimate dehydrogenase